MTRLAMWKVVALTVLLALAMLCGSVPPALATESANGGGVLFLSSFSPTGRWTEMMLAAIKRDLGDRDASIELYVEFLDRARLPDRPTDEAWAAFLATKYRGVHPQAIIADGAPAIAFLAEFGKGLFGDAPVVGIFPDFRDLGGAAKAVTVPVTTGPHIDRTVAMALSHWPMAKKLVIVSDDTGLSHHLAGVIRGAVARQRGPAVEHLSGLGLDELESRLAALPRDSVVVYTHMAVDKAGRQLRPDEMVARVAKASAAPVYVLFEGDIGSGAVGGDVNDSHVAGHVAALAALKLLDGDLAGAMAGGNHYSSQAVVDWRQLRRWDIDPRSLPPEVQVRFRKRSIIEDHFFAAMVVFAFIGVLSAMLILILGLFVQRGRHAKALREANSRLEERVAERTRDIERALQGEQAARLRLRTFLDMATHEFKTPLAVIDSSAQMLGLLVDTEHEGVGSRLSLIRRSVRRVNDLVETCLAGERIDEELPVKFKPFAPAALIRTVVERQSGHGALVNADIAGLPPQCVADPELFGIALDALLDNARRYGPPDEPIDLIARQDGPALVVRVCDRGPGVPEEEATRIFEKYYRGTHGQGTPGTGIGLNLVKTIADLHGGSIAHRPRDGGGAVFVLTLPLERAGAMVAS
ncbi:ATP-binding protein [Azospirillum sp. sgz302134]